MYGINFAHTFIAYVTSAPYVSLRPQILVVAAVLNIANFSCDVISLLHDDDVATDTIPD